MADRYPGITLHLNDMDPRVTAFWTVVSQADPTSYGRLLRRVGATTPSVELWRAEKTAGFDGSLDDLAFRALFLNRCTFSGNMSLTSGGPIGGYEQTGKWKIDARWQLHLLVPSLENVRGLLSERSVSITTGSWEQVKRIPGMHYYDPPYTTDAAQLYSTAFSVDDHIALREHLRYFKYPWVLSYDQDRGEHIVWLYKFANRESVNHLSRVQSGENKQTAELLFTPPVTQHRRTIPRNGTQALPS
jgi:DNA adenine methylase